MNYVTLLAALAVAASANAQQKSARDCMPPGSNELNEAVLECMNGGKRPPNPDRNIGQIIGSGIGYLSNAFTREALRGTSLDPNPATRRQPSK